VALAVPNPYRPTGPSSGNRLTETASPEKEIS